MGSTREQIGRDILPVLPALRAFARSLSGDRVRADDLVQETVLRALVNADKFTPGTNLTAWLVTILRNHFYSESRRRGREVEDADGVFAGRLTTMPNQEDHLALADLGRALQLLPDEQRDALLRISIEGLTYEEMAEAAGVAAGTIKSRVSRGRTRLQEVLEGSIALPPPLPKISPVPQLPAPRRKIYPVPGQVPESPSLREVGGVRFNFLRTVALPDGRVAEIFEAI